MAELLVGATGLVRHSELAAAIIGGLSMAIVALVLIGTAVAVLYITELSATKYGLGYYIYYNGSTLLDYPAMYAGVMAMSLLGLGMYFTVDWLERKWCRWRFVS